MQETPVQFLGWEDSPGEGIGYLLQYSWASLVAQLVKNPPAMQETWVQFLGWEDSPGEGKGYPLQYSGLENSMDWYSPWGLKELDITERLSLSEGCNNLLSVALLASLPLSDNHLLLQTSNLISMI